MPKEITIEQFGINLVENEDVLEKMHEQGLTEVGNLYLVEDDGGSGSAPGGGGGESQTVTLINDTLTEAVTQYKRKLTSEEKALIRTAKKVVLIMETPVITYGLAGVGFYLYANYTNFFVACNNASFTTGSNTYMFAASITDLSLEGWENRVSTYGTMGVRSTTTTSLGPINVEVIGKYDTELRATTTTEDGFPVGTVFKLEVTA